MPPDYLKSDFLWTGVRKLQDKSKHTCGQVWRKQWGCEEEFKPHKEIVTVPGIQGDPSVEFTAEFLDLSFVKEPNLDIANIPNVPLLIRDCYKDIAERIDKLFAEVGTPTSIQGVDISGTSGHGKSVGLLSLLDGVHLLRLSEISQARDVRDALTALKFPKRVHVLVDSNDNVKEPHSHFTFSESKFFIIIAASPRKDRSKDWQKFNNAAVIYVPPPDWQTYYTIGVRSHKLKVEDIEKSFIVLWPDLRRGIAAAKDEIQRGKFEAEMVIAATKLARDATSAYPELFRIFGEVSPMDPRWGESNLITLFPDPSNPSVPIGKLSSRHAARVLFAQMEAVDAAKTAQQFRMLRSSTKSKSTAGHMFEVSAHAHLLGP
ncbi:hypothetical protein EIP91_003530 [Steccherinum ochraceum]|uniref:Uncharacterized protein n=1 Tax=Steccherinum ochraceum TaxID=92696 RepID=A0A4R0RWY4_9APHY|nr:hypothetical protein EIP91_003530 [Steccherinum ochraceum]